MPPAPAGQYPGEITRVLDWIAASRALSPDSFQESPGLGGIGDRASVDGLGDLRGFPLDLAEWVGGQQPAFDGVAER